MGEVMELSIGREATKKEIDELVSEYPDLKRLLGKVYKVRKDKIGNYYVIDRSGEIEIGIGLFVAISRAEGY